MTRTLKTVLRAIETQLIKKTRLTRASGARSGAITFVQRDMFGLARSTIYRRMSEGTFPKPMRIGERSVRWRVDDLVAWRESLKT